MSEQTPQKSVVDTSECPPTPANNDTQPGNRFIVVFKDDVTSEEISKYLEDIKDAGGELKERWDENGGIINGFAATIPDSFLNKLQSLVGGIVESIEPDGIVTTQ